MRRRPDTLRNMQPDDSGFGQSLRHQHQPTAHGHNQDNRTAEGGRPQGKAEITAIPEIYSEETADKFNLSEYDYIIDAIDSLSNKMLLMLRACETEATFFSSMGAALKVDPTKIRVAEFWDVRGCPLGAALRKKFKRAKLSPARKFLCVYDDEVLPNVGQAEDDGSCTFDKVVANGTTASVTAIFGFTLSGLVVKDIYSKII